MREFYIYYQPPRAKATETMRRATTAKAAREGFEWQHPDCTVLCVYPKDADPAFNAASHHAAEFWEATTPQERPQ